MKDAHEHILKDMGTLNGWTKSTGYSPPKHVHYFETGFQTNQKHKESIGQAHAYLRAHGYELKNSDTYSDNSKFRGTTHTHATHSYEHPDGRKASIRTLQRNDTKLGAVELTADHINHTAK